VGRDERYLSPAALLEILSVGWRHLAKDDGQGLPPGGIRDGPRPAGRRGNSLAAWSRAPAKPCSRSRLYLCRGRSTALISEPSSDGHGAIRLRERSGRMAGSWSSHAPAREHGYAPAEGKRGKYHGVVKSTGSTRRPSVKGWCRTAPYSYPKVFARRIQGGRGRTDKVVRHSRSAYAIGNGDQPLRKQFPKRLLRCRGLPEEAAVTSPQGAGETKATKPFLARFIATPAAAAYDPGGAMDCGDPAPWAGALRLRSAPASSGPMGRPPPCGLLRDVASSVACRMVIMPRPMRRVGIMGGGPAKPHR